MTSPVRVAENDPPRLLMVMPYRQFVQKAKAEGFWVGAIWDPRLESESYLAEVRALADFFVLVDFRNDELLRQTIRTAAHEHRASTIYHIGQEASMVTSYEVAEELHAALNSTASIRFLADKHAMRELLTQRALSPVAFEAVPTRDEVPNAVRRIGYPVVVKPSAQAGSRGVFLWQGPDDEGTWTDLVDEYAYNGPFLVEEYLQGPEYSVETLSSDGFHQVVGITEKVLGPPPLFVEVGHIHPAPIPPEREQAIADLTKALLTTCGYRFGPAHTEVIWTKDGPRIVESQARLGGDRIPRLVQLATGLDIERAIFASMAGRPTELTPPTATALVRFFTFPPGHVDEIHGVEEAAQLPYVDELSLKLAAGDTAAEIRDSASRHGHVIVSGADSRQAQARCEEVLDILGAVIDGSPARADGLPNPISTQKFVLTPWRSQ